MSTQASTSRAYQPRPFNRERLEGLLKLEGVTWRHDIDESIEAAVEMAWFEHDRGVSATYYLMARSPHYNPFSASAAQELATIHRLGHKIGVHCDLDLPRNASIDPHEAARAADKERDLLVTTGLPITYSLSLHCPPIDLLWINLPGFSEYAYAPEWEGRYYADSSTLGNRATAAFRKGDPEDDDRCPLQINLHPEHWFPNVEADHAGFYR